MPAPSTTVVWFRRDLRVHDHPALHHAVASGDRIAPLFVVDEGLLGGRWPAANRLWFLAGAVEALAIGLAQRGAVLAVVRGDPAEAVVRFARAQGARRVVASRDHTPYGRRRDERVRLALEATRIEWVAGRGLYVHEPEAVRTAEGGRFAVFSPFHRAWQALEVREVLDAPSRIAGAELPARVAGGDVRRLLDDPQPTAERALLPEPGEPAARARLDAWAGSAALGDYDSGRDRLDRDGTSRLSQDLRWGLLSPVEVLARCGGRGAGPVRFRTEIAWRDFYAHFLAAEPRVARESFRRELDGIWTEPADGELATAWREGRTGYPVVDAAMRQVRASGWMHNRARMIVASFLAKHLGVDWRVGERHFMEHLVDGDVASNNGGWQWAASTGTDPQPYFRIFNPTLQGRRHDPTGDYVRRWVPELADEPAGRIHEPGARSGYPAPIVDHAEARARALAAYAAASGSGGRGRQG